MKFLIKQLLSRFLCCGTVSICVLVIACDVRFHASTVNRYNYNRSMYLTFCDGRQERRNCDPDCSKYSPNVNFS